MTASPPTEFASVDGDYQSQGGGILFSLSPMMLGSLVLLLGLAVLIGWWIGRRRDASDDPCEAIYDDIRKAIDRAARAPRDDVISTARKLKAVIDDRLGALLGLAHGIAGPTGVLDLALEGKAPDEAHDHGDAKPDAPPAFVVHARRDVTIHAAEAPRPETQGEHDGYEDDKSGRGHGAHAGHTKPIDAHTQVANVRAAVHDLSDHWNDKPKRLSELRAARRELTSAIGRAGTGADAIAGRVRDRR